MHDILQSIKHLAYSPRSSFYICVTYLNYHPCLFLSQRKGGEPSYYLDFVHIKVNSLTWEPPLNPGVWLYSVESIMLLRKQR